jgi:hypothetical protein
VVQRQQYPSCIAIKKWVQELLIYKTWFGRYSVWHYPKQGWELVTRLGKAFFIKVIQQ